jgi:hypothetical protein
MKTVLLILTVIFSATCANATELRDAIVGKWRPVDKKDATFTWEFQKDGALIIKGDNGRVFAGRWEVISPDLLALTQFPTVMAPEKCRIEGEKLILVSSVKGTERVSVRIKE